MPQHRSWGIALAIIVPAIALSGCKEDVKKRSEANAKSSDFWPEAPKPVAGGPCAFKYNPDNINGYRIPADVSTAPGSAVSVTAKMKMALDFRAGKTPQSRDALIGNLDLDARTAGQVTEMHLDGQ